MPILPSFVFFVLTVYFFTRGSDKLNNKFINSKIYKKHVLPMKDYKKGLTYRYKRSLIINLTITMGIGFFFTKKYPLARIIILVVYLCHLYYFLYKIKTIDDKRINDLEI